MRIKNLSLLLLLSIKSLTANAFEIFALGTSNTNCKNANQAFTTTLNEVLIQERISANVINGGIDGDKPVFMMSRLQSGLKDYPNTKIVIFEPGPNERNPKFNLEPSEEILSYLDKLKIPTIYVSHNFIQKDEDAEKMAKKYNAYYYGDWRKGVPLDRDHRQYDMGSSGGHMTVHGCQLWAKNMLPLIKQVIADKNIK